MLYPSLSRWSLLLALALPVTSLAAPIVKVELVAEKEVTVQTAGKAITKRVPAKSSAPGDVIFYTLQFRNDGDEKATKVVLDNPVPSGTRYVGGSAFGEGVVFSVDGGKSFRTADQLTVEHTVVGRKEPVQADPAAYTHVRWVIGEIVPGGHGSVGYQVRVQ